VLEWAQRVISSLSLPSQTFIVLENDKYELDGRVPYDMRFCDGLCAREENIFIRREKLTISGLASEEEK
jgi:hypothetical protein